ncbi:MAG TPA: DUF2232 domain-containing protein, partial [Longimicrobiales bacterium]|nr:DUF2232 domain-containing protein [Longimicrobiales bacterium]
IVWLSFGDGPGGTLWHFERGWALLLGAWFVLVVAVWPGRRFLPRALAAVGGTVATAAVFLLLNRGGFSRLDHAVSEQLRFTASNAIAVWTRAVGLERVGDEITRTLYAAVELQVKLYPAMLALASLAALGVAWWAFGRLARGERAPLGRLREFRFRDELVWLLVGGVVLLGLPLDALATRVGENLLTFMAVLYALRGAGVLLVISGVPGPVGMLVVGVLVVLLYPFVMATTFLVGLSDTWLDIRKRRGEARPPAGS